MKKLKLLQRKELTVPKKNKPVIHIGIDPGKSGGLVYIQGTKINHTTMPKTDREIWNWFYETSKMRNWVPGTCKAVIEKVHAMPGQGVTSMFTFGRGYGTLLMALTAAQIPFEEVSPRKWQKEMGIPSKPKELSKAEHKLVLLNKAQQLFPQLTLWNEPRSKGKQLAICDALLIAEWCKRKQHA